MSQRKLAADKLQEIQELAAGWGKIIARRVGDAAGGNALDFQAMEQIAAAATGLTEGTRTTLLEQQAAALPAFQPCPGCGRLCPGTYEDRPRAANGGPLTLHAPACHCPDCRRDFFPPAARPASGQPRF
jgi:hypothetical protein